MSQNQVIEGASATINLGSFSDAGTGENSWTVTVNWGDGSTVTSFNVNSPGPIAQSHTYAEEGNYAPTVTVIDQGGLSGSTTFNLAVADAPLTATGVPVSASEGAAVSGVKVAHFTDADPNGQASDYTATINWGDNDTTLSYNIVAATGGGFDVTASKANPYAEAGNYPISVTITETDLDAHNLSGVTPVTPSTVTTSTTATVADGLLTAVSLTAPVATEGTFWSGTVFHFTDAAGSYAKIADYTALVTLGDGTTVTLTSTTGNPNGQIVADGTGYDVNLSYTYAESIKASANATFSVKVTDAGGAVDLDEHHRALHCGRRGVDGGVADGADGDRRRPWSGTVFHFTDAAGSDAKITDYTAVVTLGDGNTVTLTSTRATPTARSCRWHRVRREFVVHVR